MITFLKSLTFSACAASLAIASVSAKARQPVFIPPPPLPAPERLAAPDAPNILLVLNDDVGFGAASTFGGPIPTPAYDALAQEGLRFNQFNTTAMCSPTRAALLTGRNPHRVNMGTITNFAINEPGYTSIIPKEAATIGHVLRDAGYSTAWFGKNHITPEWDQTAAGPFDRWPTGLGFDYFYGFMSGATDQWAPDLVENTVPVEPKRGPDYILDKDLADHLIDWVRQQHAAAPDKPFFAYLATGTAHEPHQAPADWIARFRGRFDQGWDKVREETFARQKNAGIIPANAILTPRPAGIPAWETLSSDQKRLAARMMEVHAAQRAYFDAQFGRVVAALKESGEWDNTLVVYIDGDNGASGEGGVDGHVTGGLNKPSGSLQYMMSHLEELGGPRSSENFPVGWAWAMDTPFQYFKQVASHLGGVRDGLVISWPKHITDRGGLRTQFSYVTDIAPTLYEAAGIQAPEAVGGVRQMPLDGLSLLYTLASPTAPTRHRSQYFEMLGNRSFYKDGWMASTIPPRLPWENKEVPPADQWTWALYNLNVDYSQSKDLSARHPEKLRQLQQGFAEAARQNGFRLVDLRPVQRTNPELKPFLSNGRSTFTFHRSDRLISQYAFPDVKNRNWSLQVSVTAGARSNGTIVAQGGYPQGWALYILNGAPTFVYADQPAPVVRIAASTPLPPGEHVLALNVVADGPQTGGAATVTLTVDGVAAGSGRLPATVPRAFYHDWVGIGRDIQLPLLPDLQAPFTFDGDMGPVSIALK